MSPSRTRIRKLTRAKETQPTDPEVALQTKRGEGSPGVAAYYKALGHVLTIQSRVLTGVLQHYGERGRNDELRLRQFLVGLLPKRFSVGTGFVVNADANCEKSPQCDIVIYDDFYNSPLHREIAAEVYPAEIVYGTIEVKGVLSKPELRKVCADIATLRRIGSNREYVSYGAAARDPTKPEQRVVMPMVRERHTPPRAFVVAHRSTWKRISSLVLALEDLRDTLDFHIHGLLVLESDWYIAQEAYASTPRFYAFADDSLRRFVVGMLHSLSSVPMQQANLDRYFGVDREDFEPQYVSSPARMVPVARKRT
jgi:hypothetical protein